MLLEQLARQPLRQRIGTVGGGLHPHCLDALALPDFFSDEAVLSVPMLRTLGFAVFFGEANCYL